MFLTMNPQQIQDKMLFSLFFFLFSTRQRRQRKRESQSMECFTELLKNHIFLAMITREDQKLMKIEVEIKYVVIFQRGRETMYRYFA